VSELFTVALAAPMETVATGAVVCAV